MSKYKSITVLSRSCSTGFHFVGFCFIHRNEIVLNVEINNNSVLRWILIGLHEENEIISVNNTRVRGLEHLYDHRVNSANEIIVNLVNVLNIIDYRPAIFPEFSRIYTQLVTSSVNLILFIPISNLSLIFILWW